MAIISLPPLQSHQAPSRQSHISLAISFKDLALSLLLGNEEDRQARFRDLADQELAEQEYGPQHPITKKLSSMHADVQALLGAYNK